MQLDNETPFVSDRFAVLDRDGADLLLVVVKGTYSFNGRGTLEVAGDQCPVELVDQYVGDPGESSVSYASDFSINKAGTDVAVVGHAYPTGQHDAEVSAGIEVGRVQKLVKVFGDRTWSKAIGLSRRTTPRPFERMPLLFERAFGGVDNSHPDERHHEYETRNPAGVGFRARKSKLPVDDMPLPNIEDPRNLISSPDDRPTPAGLGFIGPSWQPRLSYAGTYDDAWEKGRKPLLPDDFDDRFFNAAHPDLACPGFLKGDEEVTAIGVSPNGPIRFMLPAVTPSCSVEAGSTGEHPIELRLDKLVLEPDENRLLLLWSGSLRVPCRFQDVDVVKITLVN